MDSPTKTLGELIAENPGLDVVFFIGSVYSREYADDRPMGGRIGDIEIADYCLTDPNGSTFSLGTTCPVSRKNKTDGLYEQTYRLSHLPEGPHGESLDDKLKRKRKLTDEKFEKLEWKKAIIVHVEPIHKEMNSER